MPDNSGNAGVADETIVIQLNETENLFSGEKPSIRIANAVTILIGPNGTGKLVRLSK